MASVALFPLVSPCLSSSRSVFDSLYPLHLAALFLSHSLSLALASSCSLRLYPTPFNPLSISFPVAVPRSARTGEPIMRGCYSGPIPNHPERETGETRVQEGRMCVAKATGWVGGFRARIRTPGIRGQAGSRKQRHYNVRTENNSAFTSA